MILNRKFHFPRVQWNTFHCTLCECNCTLRFIHYTLCVFDKSHPSKCFSYESISLFWYYIKLGCRLVEWNIPLSPNENILTIALINIHYLYTVTKPLVGYHKHRALPRYDYTITGPLPPTGNLKPNLKASPSPFTHTKSAQSVNHDIRGLKFWLQEKDVTDCLHAIGLIAHELLMNLRKII